MLTRLRQTTGGSSFLVRAGLLALAAAACLFLGWFVGDRFWKEGGWGILCAFFLGLGILGCIFSGPSRIIFARAIVAFLIAAPIVCVLALIAQLALVQLNLTHFNAHVFFPKSIVGALVGVGGCILWSIKGAYNKAYQETMTGIHGRLTISDRFQVGLLAGFPLGIGAALLAATPAEPLARIALSVFWGFFSAVFAVAFTVFIDHEPAADSVMYIVVAEFLMLIILIGNAVQGLSGKHGFFNAQKVYEGLELAVPAAVICIVVYLLVCLWSVIGKKVKGSNPEIPEEAPGDRQHRPA